MKQRKLLSIALVTAGLLLLSVSVATAQGPNTACPNQGENCPSAQQGMMQGRGMRQGMQDNMQGQSMMQGRGKHSHMHQGNMQGQGMMQGRGNGQGMQGNMQGQGMMQGPAAGNMELHLPAKSETAPTADVITAMKDGIADEYNAYAAYAGMMEQFGNVAPFSNIQRAEAHHIDAWSFLFERYGLDVPEAPAATTAPEYASEAEACEAAVKVERDNIKLYDEMLDTVKAYPDMVQIVTSLRTASLERHLPALEQCAGQ